MLKNYIITAVRNLLRNRGFSFINILGLAIGLASFVLITLYVYHEMNFDRYHKKADRIYRIVENLRTENEMLFQSTSSPPMGPTLVNDFPEVEAFVRFTGYESLVRRNDISFYEQNCYLADSSVFEVFTWPLLKGDPVSALTEPNTAVITASIAQKYFGDENPIGQLLNLDGDEVKITGVMQDIPENSHFGVNILVSFSTWSVNNKENEMRAWFWNGFHTYILVREGENVIDQLRDKMPGFITRHMEKGGMYYEELPLQPLTSIYMEKPRSWENGKRGSINNVYILSIIAVFILMIACFNYINLATARAMRRLKEVGLRKVLGARRRMLIGQFLGESIIVSTVATLIGFGIAWLMLPAFNELIESSIDFGIFPSPYLVPGGMAILSLVLGFLSGVYPALMISGFQPLQIFRPALRGMFSHQQFRKILVSTQFMISITLVAGTLLVYDQLSLVMSTDLGFKKEATLILPYNGHQSVREHMESIKNELNDVEGVTSVTVSSSVPGQGTNNLYTMIEMQDGKMSPTNINTNRVDHDFIPAYGIEILAGRNFSRENKADDTTAFIINETAMKDFGWTPENAIGKKVDQQGRKGFIIGVTKDFHYRSLHQGIDPLLISLSPYLRQFSIKIHADNIPVIVDAIGKKWKSLAPEVPYRFSFLDQDYEKLYKADAQLGRVVSIFSGLAIFVGCLGLLGLTAFSVERRIKEIGIRKVLGASVGNVVLMISREFMWLILIAFVLAIPATWYLVGQWLQNFTNRITIGPTTFILAGVSVLAVAWLTISYLSFRAAHTNPSEVLRNE